MSTRVLLFCICMIFLTFVGCSNGNGKVEPITPNVGGDQIISDSIQESDVTIECEELPATSENRSTDAIPSPPTNIQASDGTYCDRIKITWTGSSGATGYKIYRANSQYGTYYYYSSSPYLYYNDYVTSTSPYWYKVSAYNSSGESSKAGPNSGYKAFVPSIPSIQATDGSACQKIEIHWTSSSGATSYNVYRSSSQTGTYSFIGSKSNSPYFDNQSTTQTFWYKVKACTSLCCSDYSISNSGYAKFPSSAPSGVTASDGTSISYIYISWASVSYTHYYSVYRSTSQSGTYSYIGYVTGTNYYDYSVSDTRVYWYKVTAFNGACHSIYSGSDSGYKRGTPLAPTNLTATKGTLLNTVFVDWDRPAGNSPVGYEVWRSSTQYGTYSRLNSVSVTYYYDYFGLFAPHFWYKVKSYNSYGGSPFAGPVEGWPSWF